MTVAMAQEMVRLAAPIYAALLHHGRMVDLESKEWQREARAAALRQALALWQQALETEA
jgi:hypothetical protein